MKIIYKESTANPDKYVYNYRVYCKADSKSEYETIYDEGFLASRIENDYFYKARSLRVNLDLFTPNSENRRILGKTSEFLFESRDLASFAYTSDIGKLASQFYKIKTGRTVISSPKARWIFTSGFFNSLVTIKEGTDIVGYCPVVDTKKILHYAYPFYKKEYSKKNLGITMMLKTILWAKENMYKYVYLGTCYSKESKYKLQFDGLEWFDGNQWNQDLKELKSKINN